MNSKFCPEAASVDERGRYLAGRVKESPYGKRGWGLVAGGARTGLLWEATADAFVSGNWIATVLTAQAICERALADLMAMRTLPGILAEQAKGWEDKALGWLVREAREEGTVPDSLLDEIKRVSDRRIPLVHYRPPFAEDTLDGRALAIVREGKEWDSIKIRDALLAEDALQAVHTAITIVFGDLMLDQVPERP